MIEGFKESAQILYMPRGGGLWEDNLHSYSVMMHYELLF